MDKRYDKFNASILEADAAVKQCYINVKVYFEIVHAHAHICVCFWLYPLFPTTQHVVISYT